MTQASFDIDRVVDELFEKFDGIARRHRLADEEMFAEIRQHGGIDLEDGYRDWVAEGDA